MTGKIMFYLTNEVEKMTRDDSPEYTDLENQEDYWLNADEVEGYDPNTYDFIWNEDYTKFKPVKLRWNDESSYRRYQSME